MKNTNKRSGADSTSQFSGSPDIDPQATERAVDGLMSMCVCSDRAEALSHNELADALTDVVWAELDMTGYPSALVDEAINRLRKIDSPCPVMGKMIHYLAQLNHLVD